VNARMDLTEECPVRRITDGLSAVEPDLVVAETRVELDVNDGALRLAMLCLPRDIEALAVGFLLGEEVLADAKDIETCVYLPAERRVVVRGRFDGRALERIHLRWTRGTGCGGGGTGRDFEATRAPAVEGGPDVSAAALFRLARTFRSREGLWRSTGGVHACALSDGERLLHYAEDVGRHNAFDKVVGMAALAGDGIGDKLILATGRLSAEIVSKAVACRVPMLVSRSAVTALAVRLARRAGITLVGFLRNGRMNVYAGEHRIRADTPRVAVDR